MRIFVGNLARDVTEPELEQAFAEFGHVSAVAIPRDRETGESRGFGFVEMAVDAEARRALAGLNGRALRGRALRVDEARPREERPPREARPTNGNRSDAFDARGAQREPARLAVRGTERLGDRNTERGTGRRQPRGEGDTWDSQRSPSGEWRPPAVPFGDDWSSPPRGVDEDGTAARGNRNSRATGKRGRDEWDGDYHPNRSGHSGGRSNRGRHKQEQDDEDDW